MPRHSRRPGLVSSEGRLKSAPLWRSIPLSGATLTPPASGETSDSVWAVFSDCIAGSTGSNWTLTSVSGTALEVTMAGNVKRQWTNGGTACATTGQQSGLVLVWPEPINPTGEAFHKSWQNPTASIGSGRGGIGSYSGSWNPEYSNVRLRLRLDNPTMGTNTGQYLQVGVGVVAMTASITPAATGAFNPPHWNSTEATGYWVCCHLYKSNNTNPGSCNITMKTKNSSQNVKTSVPWDQPGGAVPHLDTLYVQVGTGGGAPSLNPPVKVTGWAAGSGTCGNIIEGTALKDGIGVQFVGLNVYPAIFIGTANARVCGTTIRDFSICNMPMRGRAL